MNPFQRLRWSEVPWLLVLLAAILTGVGVAFINSATYQVDASFGLSTTAKKQALWWLASLAAMFSMAHVRVGFWRQSAAAIFVAALVVQLGMIMAAGTALVPRINGAHNWIVLGGVSIQPSEFIKLAVLIAAATFISHKDFDPRHWGQIAAALAIGAVPSLLIAREDLGSAITLPPLILGMLILAGLPWRYLFLMLLSGVIVITIGIWRLDRSDYQWHRLQAWLNPDAYSLSEGYQTQRSVRSIGSGQFTGKGYAAGEHNRFGWLPEDHTDMIYSIISEETGFIGSVSILIGFLAWSLLMFFACARCRDPTGSLLIGGFTCLVTGQMAINIAVATGLMPVTGVTLPFFSYGGSSLLSLYAGLGLVIGALQAKPRSFGTTSLLY